MTSEMYRWNYRSPEIEAKPVSLPLQQLFFVIDNDSYFHRLGMDCVVSTTDSDSTARVVRFPAPNR